jgi:hypothetical protein
VGCCGRTAGLRERPLSLRHAFVSIFRAGRSTPCAPLSRARIGRAILRTRGSWQRATTFGTDAEHDAHNIISTGAFVLAPPISQSRCECREGAQYSRDKRKPEGNH